MMPADGLDQLRGVDAILLGAVGYPGVPDHVSLWGLLIPIRRSFRQYVNLRPIRVFEGVESPLRGARPGEVDLVVVRENVEGEYSEVGGRVSRGFPDELAVQEAVFTRAGVTRIVDYAFEHAARPPRPRDLGDEVQRDRPHDAVLGRDRARARRRAPRRDVGPGAHRRAVRQARARPGPLRRDRRRRTSSATSSPTSRPRSPARIGIAPAANLNPERRVPVDVRAGARLGAGHRRAAASPTRSARSGRPR